MIFVHHVLIRKNAWAGLFWIPAIYSTSNSNFNKQHFNCTILALASARSRILLQASWSDEWWIYDTPNMSLITKQPRLHPKYPAVLIRTSAPPYLGSLTSTWKAVSSHLVFFASKHNPYPYHMHMCQGSRVPCRVVRKALVLVPAWLIKSLMRLVPPAHGC